MGQFTDDGPTRSEAIRRRVELGLEGEEELAVESSERAEETKTAEELAAMIHEDLSKMDGCPKRGVNVTV
jgi:hypothetical protein